MQNEQQQYSTMCKVLTIKCMIFSPWQHAGCKEKAEQDVGRKIPLDTLQSRWISRDSGSHLKASGTQNME
jgi:hypothetical protein